MVIVGVSAGSRGAAAAVVNAGQLAGVCAQERATRVRDAGATSTGFPDDAIELLLGRLGMSRGSVDRWLVADGDRDQVPANVERVDHHRAHAATAYLTSPFTSAAVVVCDHDAPELTVWVGDGTGLTQVPWPWNGPGFVRVLLRAADGLGLGVADADRRLGALALLQPSARHQAAESLIHRAADRLFAAEDLERRIQEMAAVDGPGMTGGLVHTTLAAAVQTRISDLLIELLHEVRARTGLAQLCLGGSLFHSASVNTRVKMSGVFSEVFVPPDPGNSGIAVGAALLGSATRGQDATPFLGPEYSVHETKEVLDNCKLGYEWVSEQGAIAAALEGIEQGNLVGWFQGRMEWGPRALGARSILANPRAPYVLENLNRFLKQRESWRGYALSGLQEAVSEHFDGPAAAPFMECDYRPRDPAALSHVLPAPQAALRVQTVSSEEDSMFRRLLEAVGRKTSFPFLVNTSFNGFHEPIVCSPRDAIRVFYGSGLDVLVLNQFVIRK